MKRVQFLKIWLLVISLFVIHHSDATVLYWYGAASAGGTTFSTPSNWSTSNTSSVPYGSALTSSDVVNFGSYPGIANVNCNLTANTTIGGINLDASYANILSQGTNALSVINNGVFSGGTFAGGSNGISFGGSLTISGTAFTSTSNTLAVSGGLTISSGSFATNSGTVRLNATESLIISITGGITFNKLTFAPSSNAIFTIRSTTSITVANTFTYGGTASITLNDSTINLKGDFTITNIVAGGGGSTRLIFNGTGAQTFMSNSAAGGLTPDIIIDKSVSGTLTLSGVIGCGGNWTYATGTVDAISNSSTVSMNGNKNLNGQGSSATMTFYKMNVQSGTTTLTGNLIAVNDVELVSSTTFLGNGFSINVGKRWINLGGTWTQGSGTVTFDTGTYGFIQKTGTESFINLTLNKTSSGVKLACPLDVSGVFTLTSGNLTTSATNYLNLTSAASVSGGSNTAYLNGPMRKTGNTLFTYPIGDSTVSVPYHPLKISAPSTSTDQFEAIYKPIVQTYGSSRGAGIASVSSCEYWTLDRKAGTSTPTVSLSWNSNCDNGDYPEMRVVTWTGSLWSDLGQASVTTTSPTGTVVATSAETFGVNPAPITIGYDSVNKSYSVLSKELDGGYSNVDGHELYFKYSEEYKDSDSLLSYSIISLTNDVVITMLANTNNNAFVNYGENHYKIDLYDSSHSPLASGFYMLQVTNEKNEKWYLRFKI